MGTVAGVLYNPGRSIRGGFTWNDGRANKEISRMKTFRISIIPVWMVCAIA